MVNRAPVTWNQETALSYIKDFQDAVSEEFRIVGEGETNSVIKILTSFNKFPPPKSIKPKVKGLSCEELFFLDLYTFLFVQRFRSFEGLDFYDEDEDEIVETEAGKAIITYLKHDGIVFSKLRIIVCLYMSGNDKLKCNPQKRIIEMLKQEVLTKKSIFILSKENELRY